ncbi:O-antigen ligase family protein [Aquibacillus sediminis]|uniref:O-antigen ligase family protein n=1 Tax=Aquibacillus sediminis TaxID=2574734 RepID=UPI001108ABEE|nr:O-antigen ligase family protein [Aquibacillus sediminis]
MTKNIVLYILFSLVSLTYIISPYSKGLFFDTHFIWWSLVILVSTLIWVLINQDFQYKYAYIFIFPLLYALSVFTAESPNDTIHEVIRWSTYASMLYLLIDAKRLPFVKTALPYIFYLTGTWIAVFGILSKWGVVEFQDSFLGSRMSSVIQYPNTFAAITAAFLLFGLIQLTKSKLSWYDGIIYAIPLVPLLIGVVFSSSRGVFVIFPIVWFVGLILLSNVRRQLEYMVFTLFLVIGSGIVYINMLQGDLKTFQVSELIYLLVASILLTLMVIGYKHITKNVTPNLSKRVNIAVIMGIPTLMAVIGVALVLDIVNKGFIYGLLPSNLQNRVSTISLSDGSLGARQDMYNTAMQMFKDAPLFGFGGGSWSVLFTQYQEIPFWATDVHNFYINELLNLGWIGGLLFLGVLVGLIVLSVQVAWRERKVNAETLNLAALVSIVMILAHSAMDFNMSYGTTAFVLFWAFAILLPPQETKWIHTLKTKKILKYAVILPLTLVMVFTTSRVALANYEYKQLAKENSLSSQEDRLLSVINYHPYDPDRIIDLAKLYEEAYAQSNNPNMKEEIIDLIHQAEELEPHNGELMYDLAGMAERLGERERAVALLEKSIKNDRFRVSAYHALIGIQSEQSLKQATKNKLDRALDDAAIAVAYYEQYMDISERYSERFTDKRNININKDAHYFAGQAYIIQGELQKADQALQRGSVSADEDLEQYLRQQAIRYVALKENNQDEANKLYAEVSEEYEQFSGYVKGYEQIVNNRD